VQPSTLALGAAVPVLLALTWNTYWPSHTAYAAVALTTGMALVVFIMRRLWAAVREDGVTALMVIVTALVAIVLPVLQWVMVLPSLFISSAVFGGLLIGVFRHRVPHWQEDAVGDRP